MTMKMFKPKSITDDALYDSTIAEPDTSLGEAEWVNPVDAQYMLTNSYTLGAVRGADECQAAEYYGGKLYCFFEKNSSLDGNSYVLIVDTSDNSTTSLDIGDKVSVTDSALSSDGYVCFSGVDSEAIAIIVNCNDDSLTVIAQSDVTDGSSDYRCVCATGDGYFYLFTDGDTALQVDYKAGTGTAVATYSGTLDRCTCCALISGEVYVFGDSYGGSGFSRITIFDTSSYTFTEYTTDQLSTGFPFSAVSYGSNAYISTSTAIYSWSPDDGLSYVTGNTDGYGLPGSVPDYDNYSVLEYRAMALDGIGGLVFRYYKNNVPSVARVDLSTLEVTDLDISNSSYEPSNVAANGVGGLFAISDYATDATSSSNIFDYYREPYTLGEQAIIASTHRKYQCVDTYVYESPEDGATGEDGATWVDIGATNRWASLDFEINSTSNGSGANALFWSFDIAELGLVDEVAFFGMYNIDQVRVVILESDGVTSTYIQTDSLELDPVDDADDLYNDTMYNDTHVITGLIANGLESDSILRVTVFAADGYDDDNGVGAICFGTSRTLGTVGDSSTVGLDDYSTYEYDDYGNLTTTVIPAADKGTYNLLIENQGYRYTRAILKNAIGETCVWYSYDNAGNTIPILGRYTTSTMTIVSPNTKTMPLKIKGVI